jgi:hypothetical protein
MIPCPWCGRKATCGDKHCPLTSDEREAIARDIFEEFLGYEPLAPIDRTPKEWWKS